MHATLIELVSVITKINLFSFFIILLVNKKLKQLLSAGFPMVKTDPAGQTPRNSCGRSRDSLCM